MELPWWVSIVCSAFVYLGMKIVIPAVYGDHQLLKGIAIGLAPQAKWFALLFLCPTPFAYFNSRKKKQNLDKQTGIHSIRLLDWKRFEELLGEAFRRQGYSVMENSYAGPDGGVDLRLQKDEEKALVQCKHWRTAKVDVRVVRELYGLMAAEGANKGIVVTSGKFTSDAVAFARGKAVDLIDGAKLVALVGSVQKISAPQPDLFSRDTGKCLCPSCGKEMVMRISKKGANAGGRFWGCSGFPRCRETMSL